MTADNQKAIQLIPLERLHFDPKNPRLPKKLEHATESEVLEWMLTDASLSELMGSIATQGYFAGEPLLVVPKTDSQTDFVVVEGNRRLGALKLLNNPSLASARKHTVNDIVQSAVHRPSEAPIVIYPSKNDVLDYLGYRHITGVKSWDPLEKARYLKLLVEKNIFIESASPEEIRSEYRSVAKIIGTKADYVARLILGLEIFEFIEEKNFFELKINSDDFSFSLITTALGFPEINKFLGIETYWNPQLSNLNVENLKEFTQWTFEKIGPANYTRLRESRNLSKLSQILEISSATKAFRDGETIENALLYTGQPLVAFEKAISDSQSNLEAAFERIHKIREGFSKLHDDKITDLINIARDVKRLVQARLEEQSENAN
jgi:hypothetical protein